MTIKLLFFLCFYLKHILPDILSQNSFQERDYKYNEAVKADYWVDELLYLML